MQNEAEPDKPVETQLQEVDDEHHQGSGSSESNNFVNDNTSYTQKVMDDLDALLADLQSTTAHISSYQAQQQQQQHQQQQPYRHSPQQQQFTSHPQQPYGSNFNGGPNVGYNGGPVGQSYPGVQQQPYGNNNIHYQHQQHSVDYNQQYSGSSTPNQAGPRLSPGVGFGGGAGEGQFEGQGRDPVTVKRVSYASSASSGSSTPPPLPPPPPSEVLDSLALADNDTPVYEPQAFPPPGSKSGSRGDRMSALSNNMSELDQLLQDLNSAQFMAEVDRKSSNIIKVLNYLEDQNEAETGRVNEATTVVNGSPAGTVRPAPPAVAPKPSRGGAAVVHPPQRTSVDNLLDQLEIGPQPGRFPVDPVDPNYQEISTVTTQHQRQPQHSQQYQHNLQPHNNNNSHYLAASSSSTSSSSSYHHPQTASTATRELDELMNSLSEFKLQTTDDADLEPAYAKPMKSRNHSAASPASTPGGGPGGHMGVHQQQQLQQQQLLQQQQQDQFQENGQLESMLGDLQSDMNRQGVNTKQKGVCAACQKPIVGQVIAALGKTWHVEHFVCAHCDEPLGTRNFYERDGMAYCETDYHHLFAPRCAYCNGPIVDKCIEALNKMWHPEHFFCAQCGRPFGEEDFHEKDGQAFCREDYFQMFAPKCGGCALPIMENYISALNRQWHPECFVCWDCRAPFGAGSFFDYEGLPYCETHYHSRKGSLCASCEKPITGRCITAMFRKFHPEHFVCAFCLKQLNKGTFKEQNDKPYCHPCFVKLFG